MNTDEIVRALRLCGNDCEACPYYRCWIDCETGDPMDDCDEGRLFSDVLSVIESLQARLVEYDALAAEYGIDGKTMLTLAKSQLRTARDNIKLREQLAASQRMERVAVELAGKLIAICNPPKEWRDKLFRRHVNRPGVYMGSGYDFLDGFYRLFDDFAETADEETYRAVQSVAEREFEKRHGPKGAGEGEQDERS